MTLPAHRFRGREERSQGDGGKVFIVDFDETITTAPKLLAHVLSALKAYGDTVYVLTGNDSPRDELLQRLKDYGIPVDDLVQYHDSQSDGIARAHYLKQLNAYAAIDNRIDRASTYVQVCPHLFVMAEPPKVAEENAQGSKKAAKQAAKKLNRSVDQDNGAYREGIADREAGRPMLTGAEFAAAHPDADADDYPLYVAGYNADRDDLELVPRRSERRGAAVPPPNLRESTSSESDQPEHECGTCHMYDPDSGTCWGYGLLPVNGEWVCDSWSLDPNWQEQDAAQDAADGDTPTP